MGKFCRHCGAERLSEASFCANCGAKMEGAAAPVGQVVGAQAQTAAPQKAEPPPRKKSWMDLLIFPVAILLIALGIGNMALAAVGRTVTATVTGYEQVLFLGDDDSTRNPNRYKLDYQFTVNGERYSGSVTRAFTGGSHMRQTLPVRYLPFWPHVNAEDGGAMGLGGPVLAAGGVALLGLGISGRLRLRSKQR